MRMEITARQLGGSWGLPIHVPYRGLPGRLGGDGLFAKSIIAKYTTSEEQVFPSADFAYPESGGAAAEEMLSELASQLIVMNRIRIQMNIHNRHILRQYSVSVSARCDQLLNELSRQPFLVSGVAPAAVRELRQIWREMAQNADRPASAEVPEDESSLILRVLTAASRGNGSRERYMRLLVRKLQETGADMQTGQSAGEGARSLLARAGTELFRTERSGRSMIMTSWASEMSRQFFWRIQRAPDQVRQLFLRAGGFTSLVSLEKVLRTMDDTAFRHFFVPLMERMESMAEFPEDPGTAGGAFAVTDSVLSGYPAEEDQWSEWLYFSSSAEGSGPAADLNDVSPETVLRMESFLENRTGAEWERFRTELIRTDRRQVIRGLLPEYFSEQPVTGDREKELLFRALVGRTDPAGQLRIQVLETLRKMAVDRYLPSDDEGRQTSGTADAQDLITDTEIQQLNFVTDTWTRGLEYIRGAEGAHGQERLPGTDPEMVFRMETFLENRSIEEWEQFRTELIRSDRDGEIRGLLPQLFAERQAASAQGTPGAGGGQGTAGTDGAPGTAGADGRSVMIMRQEKELLFRILREDRDAVRQLRTLVLEIIRRISLIRENQKEYMTLAESIMNLTTEEWRQLKEELQVLRTEDREIRSLVSEELFASADMEQRARNTEIPGSERDGLEAGIRMSSEKLVFLKALQEQSLQPDSVLTDAGRKLYIRTVLQSTEAGRLIQPSYRELSMEGKENWRRFLTELLQPQTSSGGAGNTAGLYFGRITERYGVADLSRESTGRGSAAGTSVRTEAALSYLERVRGERVLTGPGPSGAEQEPAGPGMAEAVAAQVYPAAAGAGDRSGDREAVPTAQAPEITAAADLTVPAAQAAAGTRSGGNGPSVRPGERTVIRTESHHDIEFETVTHTDREETRAAEDHQMHELSEVLERHEKQISKLIRTQEAIAQQDLPKEVMRQLNGKLRMERLRGGL